MGQIIGTEYVITKETRFVNTEVDAEIKKMEQQNTEWQSQINHLTSCIQANTEKIAEYGNALKALPKIIEEDML